jgi:tyrosinase
MAVTPLHEVPGLLGSSQAALPLTGAESRATIEFSPEGKRGAALLLAAPPSLRGRLYLVLERLRGTLDATILQVYVGWSADARPSLLAGSWGLFGLRMASQPHAGEPGKGLDKSFDITALLSSAPPDAGAELSVRIVPNRPLPTPAKLVVERLSVAYRPPS